MENANNNICEQYINSASARHSAFEVRLEFFVESPVDDTGEIVKKKVSDIRMSPEFAKELLNILKYTVESYEKNVGAIPSVIKK